MIYKFVCAVHEDFGEKGWKLKNMPAFDPLGGMAVAHDVLEHLPNDDSTSGEIMALGAMMYVRGHEYFHAKGSRDTRPSYHFSGELADLLLKVHSGEWVPLSEVRHVRTHEDVQEEIDNGIALVRKYLREEKEEEGYKLDTKTENIVRGLLAYGYRRAVRRYKNVSRWDLLEAFVNIEKRADDELKWAEEGEGYELNVRLRWKTMVTTDARVPDIRMWMNDEGEEY